MPKAPRKSPPKRNTTLAVDKIVYVLELKSGSQRKLTVPSTWKVTFGPTTPYERKDGMSGRHGEGTWALRLYDGDKLRAIFTDVRAFRDMAIEISEKRTRTKRQTIHKASKHGGKAVVAEATIEEWVNPDEPEEDTPEDFLTLDYKGDEGDLEF